MSLWGQPRLSGESRILCVAVTELCASQAPLRSALVPTSGTEAKSLFSGRLSQESLTSQFSATPEACPPVTLDLPLGLICLPPSYSGLPMDLLRWRDPSSIPPTTRVGVQMLLLA